MPAKNVDKIEGEKEKSILMESKYLRFQIHITRINIKIPNFPSPNISFQTQNGVNYTEMNIADSN